VALTDTFIGNTNLIGYLKSGVLDNLPGTGDLAAVKSYQPFSAYGRFHHTLYMRSDTRQAVNPPDAQCIQAYRSLVGNLAAV